MYNKGVVRRALSLAGLLGVLLALLVFVPYGGAKGITFQIKPGMGAGAVASLLRDEGVILSEKMFLCLGWARGATRHLQAGAYQLDGRQSLWQVISVLKEGRSRLVRVTVPEGYASRQIAERLERLGVCGRDEFLSRVRETGSEGTLFPQTYFFRPGMKPEEITKIMSLEFEKNWDTLSSSHALPQGLDKNGVVTLAAIVEREAKKDFERPEVAAVFFNRLQKGWCLESCATVQYALGWWKPKLNLADLKVDSSFNTYRHSGLPPGPICNPGLASLQAVFSPAKTDALFFLADGQGTHSFFTTYKAHEAEKLRRKRRSSIK